MSRLIYYLPGRGGRLGAGLGECLLGRGFDIVGREIHGEFSQLPFGEQVALIVEDLCAHFWGRDNLVVANSFGAYLFLHAQILMKPYPGKVLLLSPIVGESSVEDASMTFVPPRSDLLLKLAKNGSFPAPAHCEVHVGELDWQSNPSRVIEFCGYLDIEMTVVPSAGHLLAKDYVAAVLDKWLKSDILNAVKMCKTKTLK